MSRLSVVLGVRNEQKDIRDCLEKVKWADEIIVIDDSSTDNTVQICKEYTKKIFSFDSGGGNLNKNRSIGINKCRNDWVLVLDADEVITLELSEEIKKAINSKFYIGYNILRKNYFLGEWIQGCNWHPDYIIRLFKKNSVEWPSSGLHETLNIKDNNKIGYLKNAMLHYSYKTLDYYFEKFNRFTSRGAVEQYEKGIRVNKSNFMLYFIIKPVYFFFQKYFFYKGFKDGFRGFFISLSSALVVFTTNSKLWEKQKNS